MALIDELNESTGAADTGDTREYKNKTLMILNILRGEFIPLDPTHSDIADPILDFDSDIDLDDYTCQTVLPYGLAAQLCLEEDAGKANFFQQRYDELKRRGRRASGSEDIEDVYGSNGGLFPYNEFGMWS